ncbi:MAG: hypothetical protein OXT09_15285, partial [Myxococcales bacterium]|nr:hypothetical protein [Myxococcales bacterium]
RGTKPGGTVKNAVRRTDTLQLNSDHVIPLLMGDCSRAAKVKEDTPRGRTALVTAIGRGLQLSL